MEDVYIYIHMYTMYISKNKVFKIYNVDTAGIYKITVYIYTI